MFATCLDPATANVSHGADGKLLHECLPLPAFAQVHENGEIVVATTASFKKPVSTMVLKSRTRTVLVDGQERQETYEVPFTATNFVSLIQPLGGTYPEVQAREVSGKAVSGPDLKVRLRQTTPVLIATQDVPAEHLTVFKPETLLLIVPFSPPSRFPAPAPIYKDGVPPPDAKANAIPTAEPPASPPSPETPAPTVRLARVENGVATLRIQARKRFETTTYRTIHEEATVRHASVRVEHATLIQSDQRLPLDAVSVQNAGGETVDTAQAAEQLARERLVLVNDGYGKVDPAYLQNVNPNALVLTLPQPGHGAGSAYGGEVGAPVEGQFKPVDETPVPAPAPSGRPVPPPPASANGQPPSA